MREKLELHRADPNCGVCHNRIDPPGFALENFDPTGRWRNEDSGQPVDSAGKLVDGRTFDGPAAFKATVLADPNAFPKAFTEHLLSYALGRKLEHYDDPAIAEIVQTTKREQYKFSGIVTSYPFRNTRNTNENEPRNTRKTRNEE